ncbi:MAG: cytochrome c oxidase subunit 3 [Anaerolineales bacterium]|nr:cytochrome c oxidase subunit 3 [Anaerolineales bacterium]MCX7609795.1 cytochrome c oxidase subunit 3 [Anaerolineales bacterium]MDW8228004.1 cytochrome c oxidase subunit 3 [Anaerolineales bacterium]
MAHITKSAAFRLGLLVFGALAALTVVEFVLALYLNIWQLLLLVAILKAGLVLYYYMHIYRLFQADTTLDHNSYAYKLATNRLGLWLFFISDSFVFGGLMIARINLLGLTHPHLEQTVGLIVTAVLLISSFFMNRAETAMAHGDRKQFAISTAITLALGILFLIGVVGVEWQIAPFGPGDGAQGAVFYSMTGFHAFHVLTGVIFLAIVLRNGLRGRYSPEKHWGVEACAIYWHFVDVVWIFYYPALYLVGTAIA